MKKKKSLQLPECSHKALLYKGKAREGWGESCKLHGVRACVLEDG